MENRDVTSTIGIIVFIVLLFGFMGGGMMGFGGMGGGMMGGYSGQGAGPGGILSLLSWPVIIGGIVLLVIWLWRRPSPSSSSDAGSEGTALEILKRRFALGEITKEQFEQMRRDLE